jgi:hypothetical protein|tara:strand:+ start:387 stop:671 length:285 start_codon:yes stop_codon:yes gene_type:complete
MEEDKFIETFESLIKTIKDFIVRPVKKFTGFASLGLLLIVLLLTGLIFLFMGVLKIMQGIGVLIGINPTGFALSALGIVFLVLSLNNYRKKNNG